MTPKNCPWWIRWYHRRQRQIDGDILLPAIRQRAADRLVYQHHGFIRFSSEHAAAVEHTIDEAWTLHKQMEGQEHWRCLCAQLKAGS